MIYLFQIALLVLAVLVAWIQSRMIADGKPIYHTAWFAVWCAVVCVTLWAMLGTITRAQACLYVAACGFGHLVVFNICLNRFRGLKWNYTSLTTGSKIDQLELALFGQRAWFIDALCVLFVLTSNFFIWFLQQNSA